jgi:hypothetical protein
VREGRDACSARRPFRARAGVSLVLLFRVWGLAVMAGLASAQLVPAAGPILQVTADGTSSVRPAWSPDGTHIAFQTSRDNA